MMNQKAQKRQKGQAVAIHEDLKQAAEDQIVVKIKDVDYDTKEYPVETVVQKYLVGLATDENELFIPDYQRDFAWDKARQSKFIESVVIGLPIPYVFVADVSDKKGSEGRLEVVDGSQRIRTLAAFISGELELIGLEKLDSLNGFRFTDLLPSRQRRFNRRTIRMIELTERADEEVRRDIFERINTGSEELNDMEKRRGILKGPLLTFLSKCAEEPLFQKLVPLAPASVSRREREEYILRFFAYLDRYQDFQHSVVDFLNSYVVDMNDQWTEADEASLLADFMRMLNFVDTYFPAGFKKADTHSRTSRIRFEALSVGVALALREAPNSVPKSLNWLSSAELRQLTTSDASNSRVKVVRRIEYVRDQLLAGQPRR